MSDNVIEADNNFKQEKITVENDAPNRLNLICNAELPAGLTKADFLTQTTDRISSIESDRSRWVSRQIHGYKRRKGIRNRKTFPFVNCSNATMLTEDKVIKKLNPAYFTNIWAPKNIAEFIPDPEEDYGEGIDEMMDANAVMLDHLVRNKMTGMQEKTMLLIDKKHQTGRGIVKITYEYRTEPKEYVIDINEMSSEDKAGFINLPGMGEKGQEEKSFIDFMSAKLVELGADLNMADDFAEQMIDALNAWNEGELSFKFKINKVVAHAPLMTVIDPMDLVVYGGFNDIQEATLICHKMKWIPNDLRLAAKKGMVKADVAKKILECNSGGGGDDNTGNNEDDRLENVKRDSTGSDHYKHEEELINIYEVYLYTPVKGSNCLRKSVLVYSPDYKEDYLSFKVLPYDDDKFPFVDFPEEITDDGWYGSRGIPQQISYFSAGIDNKYNQRNDSIAISIAPMIKYVPDQVQIGKINFKPGQGVPVKNINAMEAVVIPPGNTGELLREQNQLQYMVEDFIHVPDFTLTDPNSPGSQARTATEVAYKSQDRRGIFAVQVQLFNKSWQKCLQMFWSRHLQYGKDEIILNTKDGKERIKVKWTKQIGKLKSIITPSGSFKSTNVQERRERASALMTLAKDPYFGPMLKGYDIVRELVSGFAEAHTDKFMYTRKEWEGVNKQMQQNKANAQKKDIQTQEAMKDKELERKIIEAVKKIEAESKANISEALIEKGIEQEKDNVSKEA